MYDINCVFKCYVGKFVENSIRKEVFHLNAQVLYASMVMIILSYLEIAVEVIEALMGN
jgi:hypothetical protein